MSRNTWVQISSQKAELLPTWWPFNLPDRFYCQWEWSLHLSRHALLRCSSNFRFNRTISDLWHQRQRTLHLRACKTSRWLFWIAPVPQCPKSSHQPGSLLGLGCISFQCSPTQSWQYGSDWICISDTWGWARLHFENRSLTDGSIADHDEVDQAGGHDKLDSKVKNI